MTARSGAVNIRKAALVAVLLCAVGGRLIAQEAVVTPLMTKELADMPGKEALMITVEYPPGSKDAVHRHNAHAFVYVLEGSIVMQLKGGKPVTLTPGQTFYEGPERCPCGRPERQQHQAGQIRGAAVEEARRPGAGAGSIRNHGRGAE